MNRLSIAELQTVLQNEEANEMVILPNGEIRGKGHSMPKDLDGMKVLSFVEKLGGEY